MTIFIQKNDQALSNLQKQLFETAHVMLHIFNSKGQILDANSIWLNKMGHVRDDIIGKGLVEFIDPEYNAWFSKQFDKLKLNGSLAELPVKLVKEDGTFLDILFSAKKIDLEDNHSCYLGTCTDISTENKVLDNMYKMNLALEKSNDELENFVHIVSHDLKEPIRGISFKSSVIQEDFEDELPEEAKQDLKHIGDLCKYLAALITDLGNYAQIGFLDEEKAKIDLNLLIEELNDHRVPHDSDGFVQIEVVDPLPTLNIQYSAVHTIFSNLIANGLKYNDSPDKRVKIGTFEKQNKTGIYVRDNGIGIPKSRHTAVFEMFKRLHNKNHYGMGTGAGLALVKKIITSRQGEIWIESEEGAGSTFFFTL